MSYGVRKDTSKYQSYVMVVIDKSPLEFFKDKKAKDINYEFTYHITSCIEITKEEFDNAGALKY